MTAFGALFRATRQIFIGIDEIPSQVDLAHEGQKGIAVGWFTGRRLKFRLQSQTIGYRKISTIARLDKLALRRTCVLVKCYAKLTEGQFQSEQRSCDRSERNWEMSLRISSEVPNFTADITEEPVDFFLRLVPERR